MTASEQPVVVELPPIWPMYRALVGVGLLLAGGARGRHLLAVVPVAAAAVAIMIARTPFRLARLKILEGRLSMPLRTI